MASEGKPNKKWSDHAERDLCISIMASLMPDKPKYDWARVVDIMGSLGHDFSKDAISQHWTKTIMKEFKARHGSNALGNGNGGGASSAHVTPNATPRKSKARTPASKKRKAATTTRKAGYYNGDDDNDDNVYGKEEKEEEEVEEDGQSPTKKGKKTQAAQKGDVKREVKYEDEGY